LFTNFVKSSKGTSGYDDEFETNQSYSFEIIYTNDFSEEVVQSYVFGSSPFGWDFVLSGSKNLMG
jgi:hypothetical protein